MSGVRAKQRDKNLYLFAGVMATIGALGIFFVLQNPDHSSSGNSKVITIATKQNEESTEESTETTGVATIRLNTNSGDELHVNESSGHISGVIGGPVLVNITQLP